jgi:hypothetical protein
MVMRAVCQWQHARGMRSSTTHRGQVAEEWHGRQEVVVEVPRELAGEERRELRHQLRLVDLAFGRIFAS